MFSSMTVNKQNWQAELLFVTKFYPVVCANLKLISCSAGHVVYFGEI